MAYIFRNASRGLALALSIGVLSAYGQQAPSGEQSARPGVNDRFLSPELSQVSVVLDYDKIEGVTPPRRMDHLRIGKSEGIEEILAAGFTLEAEPDLGLKENYLAIFRRP